MEEPGAAGAPSQMIQGKLYKKVSQENVCLYSNKFLSVIKILNPSIIWYPLLPNTPPPPHTPVIS